jgi:SAM-dependent methyltransferase
MAQSTGGLYSILSLPRAYSLYQSLVGGLRSRERVIREYVGPAAGDRILDIGCGPGDVVGYLPPGTRYVGFDESEEYIRAARNRFGDRAEFHCARVEEQSLEAQGEFDIVLAFGILHHLDDPEALQLFRLAARGLRPGGRLFTLDGCYVPGQSRVARWLLARDRGKNVRTEDEYLRLARTVYADVRPAIRHDLFRIPYTILVLECRLASGGAIFHRPTC